MTVLSIHRMTEPGIYALPSHIGDLPPQLLAQLEAQPLPNPAYPLGAVSHLRAHLVWMRLEGRSERTIGIRRRELVILGEWLGHDPVRACSNGLLGWMLATRTRTTPETARWSISIIRPYYRWLQAHGLRVDDPTASLPRAKRKRRPPRPIAEPQLEHALQRAPAWLLPYLLLAGWSGLRAMEVAGVRAEHFTTDPKGRAWLTVTGKGGDTRNVHVPDFAYPHIIAELHRGGGRWRRRRGNGPVQAKHVTDNVSYHMRRCGLPDTLHKLRHRAATRALATGLDIRDVQELLGHRDLNSTQIYTEVEPERQAQAIAAMPVPAFLTAPTHDGRRLRVVDDTAHGGTA